MRASVARAAAALGFELAANLETAGYPQAAAAAGAPAVTDAVARVGLRLRELL